MQQNIVTNKIMKSTLKRDTTWPRKVRTLSINCIKTMTSVSTTCGLLYKHGKLQKLKITAQYLTLVSK